MSSDELAAAEYDRAGQDGSVAKIAAARGMPVTSVLLLAYYFPPIGGAGAQRNTKLARYLPDRDYELTVVTGPEPAARAWVPLDPTMLEEIHQRVRVHRFAEPEPAPVGVWRGRAGRWLRLERPWQRWWERNVVRLAVERGRMADVVYCSVAPFEAVWAAHEVARRLDKPLIVDLEDPWALDEMMIYESRLHRHLEVRAMRRALRGADAIVMNTPEAAGRVRSTFPELADVPIVSIVNGFDARDFARERPVPDHDALRIVHTGTLHSGHRPGRSLRRRLLGGSVEINVLSRSLFYFMQALERAIAIRPELQDRVELHLAGRLSAEDRSVIGDSPLVHEHGWLSHDDTIALMRTADLLFLPMHDVEIGRPVSIVPCKTYEYLGSGRPVLAAVPDGDARTLLEAAGNACICRPTDISALADGILAAFERFEAGNELPPPDPELLARIERQSLTADVAKVVDAIASAPIGAVRR